jgi:uncharacterized protein YbaR (Trm112 family)
MARKRQNCMDKRMLSFLRCPVTHKGLAQARSEILQKLNAAIDSGNVSCRDGRQVSEHLEDALITDDGKVLYPIADGIPVLLEGESIDVESLA